MTVMIRKENKIYVAVSQDPSERVRMLAKLAVETGFARIASDAVKIITPSVHDLNLSTAYFVLASSYNFRGAVVTNQRLYELAARGIFVAVGVRSLPREYEFICRAFYPADLL